MWAVQTPLPTHPDNVRSVWQTCLIAFLRLRHLQHRTAKYVIRHKSCLYTLWHNLNQVKSQIRIWITILNCLCFFSLCIKYQLCIHAFISRPTLDDFLFRGSVYIIPYMLFLTEGFVYCSASRCIVMRNKRKTGASKLTFVTTCHNVILAPNLWLTLLPVL